MTDIHSDYSAVCYVGFGVARLDGENCSAVRDHMEQNLMKIADLLEQERDGVIETWKQEIAQAARKRT
jgi:hypothetical protein